MKKIMTILTAASLFFSLTACGQKNAETETLSPSNSQSTTSTTTNTTQGTTATPAEPEKKFEEILLVDNQDVTIKITGVEQDPIWGYTLKAFIENKTDKELMFTMQSVSINGYMCDPYWAVSVDAGKKSNTTISWLDSALEENGIETVEEITFTIRAYDNSDWLADDVFKESFTVKP